MKFKRRDYMVISDLLNAELPEDYSVNFLHIGLLYCMDVDKDGRFTIEDLQIFAQDAIEKV